jgi:hypothetical protein
MVRPVQIRNGTAACPTTIRDFDPKVLSRRSACGRKVTVPTHPSRPQQPRPGPGRAERVRGQSPNLFARNMSGPGVK